MALDFTALKVGDSVRFANGLVAKVACIGGNFDFVFDEEVAVDDLELSCWEKIKEGE